jgi:type VI protein secretion system component VasK
MNMQLRRTMLFAISASAAALATSPALAYVGPGAGLTLLGALWGLIVAVVVSLGFVLLWPLRRMMRRNRQAQASADEDPTHSMLANPSDDREERRM